ncbi:hypothetical protein [Bradyrhizobium sp. CB2312]|uniref:YunG family protein n=1 Tax=Bradyrhizobium sp. CB2312 TaxID=3039155 RepID=UPI0024B0C40A|nr:hypothetical protein [Bradyrhizobium sp. CB2312]WFU70593.1 hypothetical protein QA642_35815 [Bradyrhizobium sp. CB2312]
MLFERDRVAAALLHSWSVQTSGQWLASNPARGQCSVTALLANEFFGGEILKTPLAEGDHFYNRINGNYLDLRSGRDEALAGTSTAKYEFFRAAFSRYYKIEL